MATSQTYAYTRHSTLLLFTLSKTSAVTSVTEQR